VSKIELSIKVDYLPEWGAWQGIRELIQNGKDAETEFNAPLDVSFHNGTLRIENDGAEMPRESLLFGATTKADRKDMIGKFGEGLKLGTLALVRNGHEVKIRTGNEVWTAFIERSEKYDADVLKFDCVGGREPKKRVRVEIGNVSEEVWNELRERFLFLAKFKKDERVKTGRGDLLIGDRFRGRIYVKGIFVQTDKRLNYGYNFYDATVDRDRKMVSSWELEYKTSAIWGEAAEARPDLLKAYFQLISDGDADIRSEAVYAPKKVREAVATKFVKQFGKDVVPVANLAESHEVEHLGKRGVVVNKSLASILADTLGTKDTIMKAMREEVTRKLAWGDLDETQRTNLFDALTITGAVRPECTLDLVDVVDFRSETLLGQFKDGRILLAARILTDRDETLATLVHEYSHKVGGDGEKDHVMAIENLWRDIVKHLRKGA
jgi:hypothetical protein